MGALTVLREVSDVDGDEVTVALVDASSPSALFATLPTLSTSRFVGSGTPLDIVLSGGVLNIDESGVWTATLVVSDSASSTPAGVVTISVAPVVPVNALPSYVLGELSLTLGANESVGALTVLRAVSDADGDEVTVALLGASSPSALFSTLPTLNPSTVAGAGTPLDVVLSGGVLTTDELGVWTATLVVSDTESSTTAGVVSIEVEAATVVPVNNLPSYVLGELSLTLGANDSLRALTVLREVSDVEGDEVTVALLNPSSTQDRLFSTLPTLSALNIASGGAPTEVSLSGGVLNSDEHQWRDWTATLVVNDGSASSTAGWVW